MSRDWKPGDVGVNLHHGYRGIYVRDCTMHNRAGCWHNESGLADGACDFRRPLVVIDPEDREQAGALAEALVAAVCTQGHEWDTTNAYEIRAHMGRALRSLVAEPDPKPEEPTGLGAVVESTNGDLWVRLDTSGVWACASDENKTATYWPTITAVRVLSEGVTP